MSDQVILSAVAEIMKELKAELKAEITQNRTDLDRRFEGIDGAALLKSASVRVIDANVGALQSYADGLNLKKSVVVDDDGKPIPDLISEVLK